MRAREWAIAGAFRDPTDYNIPALPSWRVSRTERGGVAFAVGDEEPFITAQDPVRVRR
ncbi:hypothetical protein HALLA_04010 (plasmid) [Halostagnicola larsenii XH-48]|uniref:Uncharacterized protein n=1 Tax=Halostagnicola larsenii XH-48 TaxID=797299 RepID=W0JSI7_9EURY|nr:hypothetical protein [Halostagnicola larsenii]AHG01569.1 hypothetical protein HALLA_04010 [Halostagnicola larsenii XH-48]